jgi:hypothetical protein
MKVFYTEFPTGAFSRSVLHLANSTKHASASVDLMGAGTRRATLKRHPGDMGRQERDIQPTKSAALRRFVPRPFGISKSGVAQP